MMARVLGAQRRQVVVRLDDGLEARDPGGRNRQQQTLKC
jgi:hypothetical protein